MTKLYSVICGRYIKIETFWKKKYILEQTFVLAIICGKCKDLKKKINWDIKNSWFNWKYVITLKIWVKNLD